MKYLRNVKPRHKTKDSEEVPSAQKKPRAHYPQAQSVPATLQPVAGEDKASHLRHVKMLLIEERKVSPDKNAITELMKRTFFYKRSEIVEEPQLVKDLVKTYPSLKRYEQVHCT